MKHWRTIIALAGLGLLGMPLFGADFPANPTQPANFPDPGTLNYIQGAVNFNGEMLTNKNVVNHELGAGQELTTGAGKVEILLTPGIFLRVGSNSTIKMISPDLERTQVALLQGEAGVEVDHIFPQNMVQIIDNGVTTQLIKNGYYEFDANHPEAMVYKGKAEVETRNGKWEAVKGDHELALAAGTREKAVGMGSRATNDDLYNWSKLRSEYLAEEDEQAANEYGWGEGYGPGWLWNPWDMGWGWWGPGWAGWGWGPGWGWGLGPWWGGGFYGGGFYGGRGFHGGRGFGGGGFHGGGFGGGGFHGGGGGGGGHR